MTSATDTAHEAMLTDALRAFVDLSRDTFERTKRQPGGYQTFRPWLEDRAANGSPVVKREADALLTAMDLLGITE